MRTILLSEIQKIESEIAKAITEISERENMPVYMICGSVLGIIRDNGFIPWDDDVDIGVPYDYYWKLIDKLEAKLDSIYCVAFPQSTPKYNLTFARVGITNVNLDDIHVDLFPMVGLPDEAEEQKKYSLKSDKLNKLYFWKHFEMPHKKRSVFERIIKRSLVKLIHLGMLAYPNVWILNKFYNHCAKYTYADSKYIMNSCGHYGLKNVIPMDYVGETLLVDYFGAKVRIPQKTDEYLRHYYKDYMEPPAFEETEPLMKKTANIPDSVFANLTNKGVL